MKEDKSEPGASCTHLDRIGEIKRAKRERGGALNRGIREGFIVLTRRKEINANVNNGGRAHKQARGNKNRQKVKSAAACVQRTCKCDHMSNRADMAIMRAMTLMQNRTQTGIRRTRVCTRGDSSTLQMSYRIANPIFLTNASGY